MTLIVAREIGGDVCVLLMAHDRKPGGVRGPVGKSQLSCLCSSTTFHVDVGQHHYPLNQWDVLYVPDVVVFRVAECQMSLEP